MNVSSAETYGGKGVVIAISRLLRRFRNDQRGSFSIEFVVWLPFVFFLVALSIDVSISLFRFSRVWDIARDTARRASTGDLTAQQAEAYALSKLPGAAGYSVAVDDSAEMDVTVSILAEQISPMLGRLEWFSPGPLGVDFTMRKEGG